MKKILYFLLLFVANIVFGQGEIIKNKSKECEVLRTNAAVIGSLAAPVLNCPKVVLDTITGKNYTWNGTVWVGFIQTATQTPSTPISASATQVANPATNVQGAISNVATSLKSVETTASNGLTKNVKNFELGQAVGAVGNPAALTSNREIPLNGRNVWFSGNGNVGLGENPIFPLTVKGSFIQTNSTNLMKCGFSLSTAHDPSEVISRVGFNMPYTEFGLSNSNKNGAYISFDSRVNYNSFSIAVKDKITNSHQFVFGASDEGHILIGKDPTNGSRKALDVVEIFGGTFVNDNIGIGIRPNPSFKLDVAGTGRFTGSLTAASYITSSDKNIKDNIEPIKSGLDIINKLNPVTFYLKDEYNTSDEKDLMYGFIAQEVQELIPEIVKKGKIYNRRNREQYSNEEKECNESIAKIEAAKADKLAKLKELDPLYDKKFAEGGQDKLLDVFDEEIKKKRDILDKRKYLLEDDDILQIHNANDTYIALLVKALQEQQIQIQDLKEEFLKLKNK